MAAGFVAIASAGSSGKTADAVIAVGLTAYAIKATADQPLIAAWDQFLEDANPPNVGQLTGRFAVLLSQRLAEKKLP